ncbi:hypothetical protein JB92DRAFT_2836566 [Gautieria morchelliformis]|nr:hypothetical protein JB92DRAFT_2836566 [Gautieria morchelliformis]
MMISRKMSARETAGYDLGRVQYLLVRQPAIISGESEMAGLVVEPVNGRRKLERRLENWRDGHRRKAAVLFSKAQDQPTRTSTIEVLFDSHIIGLTVDYFQVIDIHGRHTPRLLAACHSLFPYLLVNQVAMMTSRLMTARSAEYDLGSVQSIDLRDMISRQVSARETAGDDLGRVQWPA